MVNHIIIGSFLIGTMETIEIEGKTLHLAFPDEAKFPWIGESHYLKQIQSAWSLEQKSNKKKRTPFNPKILGRCGMGKSTLAYSASKFYHSNGSSEVYILHCSESLNIEDAIIHQVKTEKGVEFHASPLVTAMIKGEICVIDECQYLSPATWAVISTVLDQRYVVSDLVGIKIRAKKSFHLCVTESYFDPPEKKWTIPKYISAMLKPVININHPSRKHEFDVLIYYFPDMNRKLIHNMVDFLQTAHFEERPYSIRDVINILQKYEIFTESHQSLKEVDWNLVYQSIRQILDNQAIYFLNDLLNQSKDSDTLFEGDSVESPEEDFVDPSSEITDFFEDDENYAEFIDDEEFNEEFNDEIDDSLTIYDDDDDDKSLDFKHNSDSHSADMRYLKKIRKKIRGKLNKMKKENQE